MKRIVIIFAAAGALVLGGALASACSSASEEATPTRPPVPIVPPDSDSGSDAGVDSAPVDPGCLGAAGCFKCEPAKTEEFLNACTDGQCTPFDNAARLPLFKAGQA